MRAGLLLPSVVLGLFLAGCGPGQIVCESRFGTYCDAGVTYWVDDCGNLEEVLENCPAGCNALNTGCSGTSCTPDCTGQCCGDDGCGGVCPDSCSLTGQVCNQSSCQCQPGTTGLPHFSFFVTSLAALQDLSGSQDGFGGDFTYGEIGAEAGLSGADKICAEIAERSMPGSSAKQWRAFLCTSYADAIDRIGDGPWYDRMGRLVANNKSELLNDRPLNADPEIKNDLPNEDGVPNHQPDPTQPEVDNHHMLTGCDRGGRFYSATATCRDWTTADGSSANGSPQCGLSWPRGGGGDRGSNWISDFGAPGCAAGIELEQLGGPAPGSDSVGAGGGYGGFYCFALEP